MVPEPSEYAPYYGRYISLVPAGVAITTQLERQLPATLALVRELDPEYRYAPGKWNVKQVVGHLIDTERVMAYRALRISRNDPTPLVGFDQDVLVNGAVFEQQSIEELLEEFEAVRRSTLCLFRPLTPDMWLRMGTASEKPVSTRALAYIIAGHEAYHAKLFDESYRSGTRG
jgi:hypothetical protein